MGQRKTLKVLGVLIALLSAIAAVSGIFSSGGPGPSTITSVRGKEVTLYGKGIYHHMSAEVAPQGIAQDFVTLFIGIPLLLVSLAIFSRGSLRSKILFAGVLAYFLTTYLFYTLMAMYNQLFLLWVAILSLSFHAFIVAFKSVDEQAVHGSMTKAPIKSIGIFLIFCALAIGILWISIVIPPLLNGTVPEQLEHYTTLVVQALDLSIGLPAAFIAGYLLLKGRPFGSKLSAVYMVFLSLLMTALSAKVIAMAWLGQNVIPVILIIPTFNAVSIFLTVSMFRSFTNSVTS